MRTIEKCAQQPAMVLGITGFTDATEILEELFTLVATIELV